MDKRFMREAISLAINNIDNGGGPFGAVVVKNGQIVGRGGNRVTASNDPTAHAEVCAIRDAAHNLSTFDLSGCEVYTTCEPCPMCLGAIYWARIDHIYYACTQSDAAEVDFDDAAIYKQYYKPIGQRTIGETPLLREESKAVFDKWKTFEQKKPY